MGAIQRTGKEHEEMSDRKSIDANIERTRQRLAALEAFKAGCPVQTRVNPNEPWEDTTDPGWYYTHEYRPKPQRKLIPYTYDNCPLVAIQHKHKPIKKLIIATRPDGIVFNGVYLTSGEQTVMTIGYQEIMEKWTHLDGSPCGTYVEEE